MYRLLHGLRANKFQVVVVIGVVCLNWYWWTLLKQQTPESRDRLRRTALIGTRATPIAGVAPDGTWQTIAFSGSGEEEYRNAILYALSPTCVWCDRNTANIRALAESVKGRSRVIGLFLSSGDATEYASSHGLEFPLYSRVSDQTRLAYNLGGTPQTIAIRDGVITANWIGAYSGGLEHEVSSFFDVILPGLQSLDDANPNSVVLSQPKPRGCTVPDGGFYSPGAVRQVNHKRIRCQMNGTWAAE